jgi:uncharacterized protein (DUF885 family)
MRPLTSVHASELLTHFVDEYTSFVYENFPTEAGADGVHGHDDLLEDFGRSAIDGTVRQLGGWARRLDGINPSGLTQEEKLDRRLLGDCIRSRMYALEQTREWERNPLYYADTLLDSLASQIFVEYADLPARARRISSKLRQAPRLLEAARENVTESAGLFVRVGINAFEDILQFVERQLPRAFRNLEDMHLLSDLADASGETIDALRGYIVHLRENVAPRSRASFRLGADVFGEKLLLDEGIDVPLERLIRAALAELGEIQEEFLKVSKEIDPEPSEALRKVSSNKPVESSLQEIADAQVGKLREFIERKRVVTIPENRGVAIIPTPRFYRPQFKAMWLSGPFETTSTLARLNITRLQPSVPGDEQAKGAEGLGYSSLTSILMREVFPGRFLNSEYLRNITTPLRKSRLFAATSFVDGWANYSEQVMLEQGFERKSSEVKLGQLSQALIGLCRTIVGIRLHAEDLSVEQGMRFFRDEAYLDESDARAESERGTFDSNYVLGALGRQMIVKLRQDCEATQPDSFDLMRFHDKMLGQGALPFWMHRALLLGSGTILD